MEYIKIHILSSGCFTKGKTITQISAETSNSATSGCRRKFTEATNDCVTDSLRLFCHVAPTPICKKCGHELKNGDWRHSKTQRWSSTGVSPCRVFFQWHIEFKATHWNSSWVQARQTNGCAMCHAETIKRNLFVGPSHSTTAQTEPQGNEDFFCCRSFKLRCGFCVRPEEQSLSKDVSVVTRLSNNWSKSASLSLV